jgi:hypothetical protein
LRAARITITRTRQGEERAMSLLRWMLLIVTINVALAGCTPVVSPSFKGHRLPGNIAALTGARAEKLRSVRDPTELAPNGFLSRILDGYQHGFGIGSRLVAHESACELSVSPQLALLKQRPHFPCKLRGQ